MFASRYFPIRYFSPRYWASVGAEASAMSTPTPTYAIEYRTDPHVVFWTVNAEAFWTSDSDLMWEVSGAWLPWTGEIKNLIRQQYEFRLRVNPGPTQGRVTALTVNIDMPDKDEKLLNVAIGSSGTRLTLTKSYQSIKVVSPQLLDDGGTATHIKVVDKDTLGPLLKAYDKDNVLTTAHADVTVQGY